MSLNRKIWVGFWGGVWRSVWTAASSLGPACNYSLYEEDGDIAKVPFVPCGQMYIANEVHTVNGQNVIMNEVIL